MRVTKGRRARAWVVASLGLLLVLALSSPGWGVSAEGRRRRRRGKKSSSPSRGPATASNFKPCQTAEDCTPGELCSFGKCRCPILYRGPGCTTVNPTRGKWCVTPFSGYLRNGYNPKLNFTSCAVVGNSNSVKDKEWGEEIDAHSVVIRFNEAPTVGYKKYVGDWHPGTIRIQNKERGGFAERKGEHCVVWPNNVYQRRRSDKKCDVHRMKNSFAAYARTYWKAHSPPGGGYASRQRAKMSNGFLGIVVALHKCAHVDVYGFTQGSGHYFKKFTGKPKGFGNPNKAIIMNKRPHGQRHSWSAEKACIKRLSDEIPEFIFH
ncbi:hypothetical protein HOP50_08g51200 [Chloropicon primus]|nr:hypothetical protein HOP50_08g51200 [Chloropicon primus]